MLQQFIVQITGYNLSSLLYVPKINRIFTIFVASALLRAALLSLQLLGALIVRLIIAILAVNLLVSAIQPTHSFNAFSPVAFDNQLILIVF
jgi:hypothetical protein